MGVLNKLKSRMRGPAKSYEGYDTMGFSSGEGRSSGVDYVTRALEVAANQPVIENNTSEQMADTFDSLAGAAAALASKESDRSKSIKKSKKEGKTGKEARANWKKEREEKKKKEKEKKREERLAKLEKEKAARKEKVKTSIVSRDLGLF